MPKSLFNNSGNNFLSIPANIEGVKNCWLYVSLSLTAVHGLMKPKGPEYFTMYNMISVLVEVFSNSYSYGLTIWIYSNIFYNEEETSDYYKPMIMNWHNSNSYA